MIAALTWGLLSALLYGATDFIARFASRSEGVLRTMLYGQSLIAVLVGAYLLWTDVTVEAPFRAWFALVLGDAAILSATAFLYRAVSVGRLSVVAPIVAGYGIVGALLSVASGERLSALATLGMALAAFGAMLAAVPPRGERTGATATSGAKPAAAAALLYGFGFWLQGRFAVPVFGSIFALWSYYALGAVALLAIGLSRRHDLHPPAGRNAVAVYGVALCASAAYLALVLGQATGAVGVVTALSALASAVTVLLARVFLKERISLPACLGLATVVGGLALLHGA